MISIWVLMSESRHKGNAVPSLGNLLLVEERMRFSDRFQYWLERHLTSKILHQLPSWNVLSVHSSSFITVSYPVWKGHCIERVNGKAANWGSPGRMAVMPVFVCACYHQYVQQLKSRSLNISNLGLYCTWIEW